MKLIQNQQQSNVEKIKHIALNYGFYIIFVIMFIVYSFASKNFLSFTNFTQVFLNSSSLLIIAGGLTAVILTGAIDLSVGSIAFVSASLLCVLAKKGVNPWLALFLAILSGAMIGAINALFITRLRMNPMLVTLGMMTLLRGIALHIIKGMQVFVVPEIKTLGLGNTGPFPIPVIVTLAIVLLVISQFVYKKTKFGRYVVAVGCNSEAARKVGINVTLIKFLVFIISGTFASIGGIVAIINIGAVQPFYGKGIEFIAVAAVVMGGTSLFGGKGSIVPGTLMGVLMLTIIENGLNLVGASAYSYPFVRGLIIFFAMYADSLKKK